ncbi:unnamed protein product [Brachionus calyciflorus]|uniref:Translation initiation factor eIF2B subunit delta n=1 Tax=Brachionus calyciflorus TaxID=104777 RepID=A0A813M7N0_9BILA|nr:unnamed protein product [Brachionus calyciflorus]
MSSQNNPVKTTENQTNDQQESKSKADLRRERRAKQEEQRAKKTASASGGAAQKPTAQQKPPSNKSDNNQKENKPQITDKPTTTNTESKQSQITDDSRNLIFETAPVKLKLSRKKDDSNENINTSISKLRLFHHFEEYKRDYSITEKLSLESTNIHPEFIKLGLQSAHDKISCSNTRCIGFLNALKQFIIDLKFPSNSSKTLSEFIEYKLKANINFLTQCRPLSVSQGNAIKEMKQLILHLPNNISESEAKELLIEEIEKFIDEKILLAADMISKYILADVGTIISGTSYARSKISNNDTILIYGYSSLVTRILIEAKQKFSNIHVVVVDSRPKYRGKQALEKLLKHDIDCSYVLINGISYIMNRVNKVILGAHALLANGYVMGQIGSSQIALVAKSFNVPVVVCCETYKFCDKVQTDALVKNELGNPYDLLKNDNKALQDELPYLARDEIASELNENITLLNLTYDVCTPDLISCVVTDMGMLPCTSVPVVLRLKNRDLVRFSNNKNSIDQDDNKEEN